MTIGIYWFRNDLRLKDNSAFLTACREEDELLPIYVHPSNSGEDTQWGFPRVSSHRKAFLNQSLQDLKEQLKLMGSDLLELKGDAVEIFAQIREELDVDTIYCEHIEAPEELGQIEALKNIGFEIDSIWQSSMLDIDALPFDLKEMPDVFTQCRQQIEKQQLRFSSPVEAPVVIPPLPNHSIQGSLVPAYDLHVNSQFMGGERAARVHIDQYFKRQLVDTYKQTRNQLIGMDYSSKFSPWLALGCCSARSIAKDLEEYETNHGANEGTYWLWFELLWRDYFRFLHFKYGKKLYHPRGLVDRPAYPFDEKKFEQWASGNTGESFVDAGMRQLKETGYLSNRMRQIVASYWIYNMEGDWRAGAAWFESQLIDYDVYSNQGNWLYIAGKGTDPRGGRAFNVAKQVKDHDPDGIYQRMWLSTGI